MTTPPGPTPPPGPPPPGAPPALVLGPMTRFADATTVTVWVETSAPAEVEVAGRRSRTFEVEGHHYALVVVDGLEPGSDVEYAVALDGRAVWPEPGAAPSRLRTLAPRADVDVVLGSCRVDRPQTEPFTLQPDEDPRGVGVDALAVLARACRSGERPLPDLVLLLGDQVYADEGLAPRIREWQAQRRGHDSEPRGEVADFEEYTWLYHDSWSEPDVRWLLSTVPSAMVFDDHDVRDDWNTSQAWRHRVQRLPWWRTRITGAYMSYWLYQHLGNISPAELAADGLLARLQGPGERGAALQAFAERADDEVGGRKLSLWSYTRDLGAVRLVVVDSRSGRVLEDHLREMLSEPEWERVERDLRGDCDHLLVATSLPLLLEHGLHDLEGWDERLCGGAWGPRAARFGEALRQGLDLEHWAAFRTSFDRLVHRLGEVAAGRRGRAPRTVLVLSGDVHHTYVAPMRYDPDVGTVSAVAQVTSSPLRNAYPPRMRRAFRVADSRAARLLGRLLARSVRLPDPEVTWSMDVGPFYGNGLIALRLDAAGADLRVEQTERAAGAERLRVCATARLDPARPDAPPVVAAGAERPAG